MTTRSKALRSPDKSVVLLLGLTFTGLAAWGLRDPLASMASYTAALMALNQLAPPLLLLGLPQRPRDLDPWAATLQFVALGVLISLPGLFDRAVVNALYAAPLGLLELLSGLWFWALLLPGTRSLRQGWQVGLVAWLGGMPMMVVALVWMLSPTVLYTPYLDVICRWDVPPAVDQRWAGLVMFAAGLPLQAMAAWALLGLGKDKQGLLF
jgi:putative membrane protein